MVEVANAFVSGDLGVELEVSEVAVDLPVLHTEYNPDNYLVCMYDSARRGHSSPPSKWEVHRDWGFQSQRVRRDKPCVPTRNFRIRWIEASTDPEFPVQNVVCTDELPHPVNLKALAIGLGLEAVEYEPEQFPGLIYRPKAFSAVLLVFANGRVVITGAADVKTAKETFSHL